MLRARAWPAGIDTVERESRVEDDTVYILGIAFQVLIIENFKLEKLVVLKGNTSMGSVKLLP